MNTPLTSLLGKDTQYPEHYDASLLFPIARQLNRSALGITDTALPFHGMDRWSAYELSWLNAQGKPQIAVASFYIPASSPHLIESKSFKLYLNSLNNMRYSSRDDVEALLRADLSKACGAEIRIEWSLPAVSAQPADSIDLDELDISIDHYGEPDRSFLRLADNAEHVREKLHTDLFKSNCPVTSQPDWASISIEYSGAAMDHAGLLRYLVSFRNHAEFHEACVERIFTDISNQLKPESLLVEARYTRRGGLDINPWRASLDLSTPERSIRDERQ